MMTRKDFQALHVLVIDDEDFMRKLIVRLLREIGVRSTSEASNGKFGLEVLENRASDIDLILCDLEMPEMDGLQFIHNFRSGKFERAADLPIIVLTGHAEDEVVRGVISENIQGYLVKPISKKMLVERIVHAMNTAR